MRALVIDGHGSIDDIEVRELDRPEFAVDELLIGVKGAALNPADIKVVTGKDGGKWLHASGAPIHLGFDFSGEVEGVGPDSEFDVGDDVFGHLPYKRSTAQGSFADHLAVPASAVARKSRRITHSEAATLATCGLTALQGLRDVGGLGEGQRVLINGASGGVGAYAVQIAKALGAEVWARCGARKMSFVEALGADRVIDYAQTPIRETGVSFDVIFDAAAATSYRETHRLLKKGGAFVTTLPSLGLVWGKLRTLFSSKSCNFVVVQSKSADLAQLTDWVDMGLLEPKVHRTWPLEEVPQAMKVLASGEVKGKIAIDLAAAPPPS